MSNKVKGLCHCQNILNNNRHLHAFTKLLQRNALAVRPCNCEAVLEPLLPKVAHCIPFLSSHYIGNCTARVLKRSDSTRFWTESAFLCCHFREKLKKKLFFQFMCLHAASFLSNKVIQKAENYIFC